MLSTKAWMLVSTSQSIWVSRYKNIWFRYRVKKTQWTCLSDTGTLEVARCCSARRSVGQFGQFQAAKSAYLGQVLPMLAISWVPRRLIYVKLGTPTQSILVDTEGQKQSILFPRREVGRMRGCRGAG